jgi:enoyl-CoA hydratase/carnithine racemase
MDNNSASAKFNTVRLTLDGHVARIELNRPEKANAMELSMWQEIRAAMHWLDMTPEARVGVISGVGKHFTAGIDLSMLAGIRSAVADDCGAHSREKLRSLVLDLQDTLTSIERCRKPVIAEIHGACVGGGIDLITACDLRYCSKDAFFSVKEIDIGMTADVGTLQRLPKIVGEGLTRELAYTGRNVNGEEAQDIRLVNRCHATRQELSAGVAAIAAGIAAKSPLAVRGCKEMITYARDHSVADGLNYIATWNAAMLLSSDLDEALAAGREKRPPVFKN